MPKMVEVFFNFFIYTKLWVTSAKNAIWTQIAIISYVCFNNVMENKSFLVRESFEANIPISVKYVVRTWGLEEDLEIKLPYI